LASARRGADAVQVLELAGGDEFGLLGFHLLVEGATSAVLNQCCVAYGKILALSKPDRPGGQ